MSNKFKDLINKHQISQSKLAGIIGVSRPTIIKILAGKRELRISEADKLAMNLGISTTEIFGETSEVEVILEKKSAKKKIQNLRSALAFPPAMSKNSKTPFFTLHKKLEPYPMSVKPFFTKFYIFAISIITKNMKNN